MRTSLGKSGRAGVLCLLLGLCSAYTVEGAFVTEYVSGIMWAEPKVVEPGTAGSAPSDAVVLFDGKDLSQWEGGDKWKIEEGYAIAEGGGISTKQGFGDCQLHLEFATPAEVKGNGQGRGNSGVYFMGTYEVQILDSFDNKTYFDGQCASIYKQFPPLVNACRKPGEWQTYDIVFTAPKFDDQGKVTKPATFTVLQNGVLVQNHTELLGGTFYDKAPAYHAHADKLPIQLQYHGNPIRYRNIWLREIPAQALKAE
ncbi:MAG: DUF1080 domain-containing protein [Planctomycetota bacterium]